MSSETTTQLEGRTRWRRFFALLLPVAGLMAVMVYEVASGAVAVSFAVSGTPFTVTADSLSTGATDGNGVGFYQFGVADFTGAGSQVPQAENIIPNATLVNLCQSVAVGPLILRLTAGTVSGSPVRATNLVVDATSLSAGTATFTNINIGQDMGTYSNPALTEPAARGTGPNVTNVNVPTGTFGQVATGANISGLRQVSNGTSASSFTLPNLSLGFGGAC